MTRSWVISIAVGLVAAATSAGAQTEAEWPTQPLRIVVPYPAGGVLDAFARQYALVVSAELKQPVVVDNRPGGAGMIGLRAVSNGPADSHTLFILASQIITMSAMDGKVDVLKELKPVVRLTATPSVCVVHPDAPWKTLRELVAAVSAKPDSVRYASAGSGSPAHMAVVYLDDAIGDFKATEIPYKGANESTNALLGNQIEFSIIVLGAAIGQIKAGRLRPLAVSSRERVAQLPDVPTVGEALGKPYVYLSWSGIAMHPDTPDDVVKRVAAAFERALSSEGVKALLASTGTFPDVRASPAAFSEQIRDDLAKERRLLVRLGLTKQ